MSFFTTVLSARAHSLRLPADSLADVERFVQQHQKGRVSAERAPFRRQLDFWAFSIGVAVASGRAPVDASSVEWRRFADTRSVQMPDDLCDLLAVLALAELGAEHPGVDDSAEIIELGNRLAAAGCPLVIDRLRDPDLRLTPLDKTLEYAAALKRTSVQSLPTG